MNKKYIFIIFIVILTLSLSWLIYLSYINNFYSDKFKRSIFINDLLVLSNWINNINEANNYMTYFLYNWNNDSFTLKDIENILIDKNIIKQTLDQPYFNKFKLEKINKKCFIFYLSLIDIKTIHKESLNYYKNNFWKVSYRNKWWCDSEKCYLFFTEKWLLSKDDIYECNY